MNAKMNQNATIGEKFEQRFLQELQARFKMAKTSRSTDHMFICDIVHDECLIELKSTRDNYKETTVETFTRICKYGLKDFKKNGRKKGLFFQIVEMLKFERSMVIAGTYKIEPNKLYNLWIRNPDQAWSNYTEYKIMTHWFQGSTYTRIPASKFWAIADKSHSLRDFKGNLEEHAADQHRETNDSSNHWWESEFSSALCQLNLGIPSDQIESLFDDSFKGLSQPKRLPQTWIEKEKQAKLELIEAVAEPVEAVAERTDGYTYPIIEQTGSKIYNVLLPESLKRIEDGVRNQVRLSDLSIEFGKSPTYLHATLSNYDSYKDEIWVIYKKWLINLMSEVGYIDQPKTTITSLERAQSQVSKYKREMTKLIDQLAKQEEKYEAKIKKLDDQINNLETNQVDETTTLKLEAYQAEIKKLQAELKECTQYNNEFTEIKKSDEIKIESLQNLCSKQLRELTQLKTEIKNIKLEQQEIVVSNGVQEDLNRYKRIIDLLLDK